MEHSSAFETKTPPRRVGIGTDFDLFTPGRTRETIILETELGEFETEIKLYQDQSYTDTS